MEMGGEGRPAASARAHLMIGQDKREASATPCFRPARHRGGQRGRLLRCRSVGIRRPSSNVARGRQPRCAAAILHLSSTRSESLYLNLSSEQDASRVTRAIPSPGMAQRSCWSAMPAPAGWPGRLRTPRFPVSFREEVEIASSELVRRVPAGGHLAKITIRG